MKSIKITNPRGVKARKMIFKGGFYAKKAFFTNNSVITTLKEKPAVLCKNL